MDFMMTLSQLKMLFCKISLNDNGVWSTGLSIVVCAVFICSIKAAVSSIKFPVVGLLEFISKKKNLRFVNKKPS